MALSFGVFGQKAKIEGKQKSKPLPVQFDPETERILKSINDEVQLTNVQTNKWIFITSSGNTEVYFNPSKTVRSNNIVEYWTKEIAIDKKKHWDNVWKTLEAEPPKNFNPENYSYSLVRYEVNCEAKTSRFLQEVTYMKNGGTGGVDLSNSKPPMKAVVPDSVGELLLQKACAVK